MKKQKMHSKLKLSKKVISNFSSSQLYGGSGPFTGPDNRPTGEMTGGGGGASEAGGCNGGTGGGTQSNLEGTANTACYHK